MVKESGTLCVIQTRHTSNLENFNSMLPKYAPKRITLGYEVFTGRILLAALDHTSMFSARPWKGSSKRSIPNVQETGGWNL